MIRRVGFWASAEKIRRLPLTAKLILEVSNYPSSRFCQRRSVELLQIGNLQGIACHCSTNAGRCFRKSTKSSDVFDLGQLKLQDARIAMASDAIRLRHGSQDRFFVFSQAQALYEVSR